MYNDYSYPGVYVEEVPSGVRTITGVSTSITAFIGRAVRGEVDTPILITSYAGFERTFGGLHVDYPMSYAVKDFFLNGGSQALIVRIFKPIDGRTTNECCATGNITHKDDDGENQSNSERLKITAQVPTSGEVQASPERMVNASLEGGMDSDDVQTNDEKLAAVGSDLAVNSSTQFCTEEITEGQGQAIEGDDSGENIDSTSYLLKASNPGTWGNKLCIRIDHDGLGADDENFSMLLHRYGLGNKGLTYEHFFNLTVIEGPPDGLREVFQNITLHPDGGSRRIDRVLKQGSNFIRWPDQENSYSVASENSVRPKKTNSGKIPTSTETTPDKIDYFENGSDGALLTILEYSGSKTEKTGVHALEKADLFNLLCIPPDTREGDPPNGVYDVALKFCIDKRAMLIVDPPSDWGKPEGNIPDLSKLTGLGLTGPAARNAAIYFPRVIQSDPLRENQLDTFVPCGIMAGLMAQTDALRGVWKAPAGTDAALRGVKGLSVTLTDAENGQLNPLGINCLRSFPLYGHVAWGARTLRGANQMADEYRYIPVRRLALYIEESLYRGLKWVVFEPNDEPLWQQIRTNVKVFMHDLFKLHAFQGSKSDDAYLVKCDSDINTQSDINKGVVNILVGFAPLKPAEFVIIRIQQLAGQLAGA